MTQCNLLRFLVAGTLFSAGCALPTEPLSADELGSSVSALSPGLERQVRQLAADHGVTPLASPPAQRPELVELGRLLSFDKILSGDRDISCMTCHHPSLGLGDGRSLSVGRGAVGLGPSRVHPEDEFIPRNAPTTFNLAELSVMFWDGRVAETATGIVTPAGTQIDASMEATFALGAPAAQAMFPVTSRAEMRGFPNSVGNELGQIDDADLPGIWSALMNRLGAIPEYVALFEAAYPGTPFPTMTFAHAANAIASFEIALLTLTNAPFDRFLAGESTLSTDALLGARWFFTQGGCASCHNGPALTDQAHHNSGVRQLGPGKGNGVDGLDDFGRENVSGDINDRYAFRTPPLRNVTLTGPWGHAGQFTSLTELVDHYSDPSGALHSYDGSALEPLLQPTLLNTAAAIEATLDPALEGVHLNRAKVDDVVAFLETLTDPAALDLTSLIPVTVPSGLPVAD